MSSSAFYYLLFTILTSFYDAILTLQSTFKYGNMLDDVIQAISMEWKEDESYSMLKSVHATLSNYIIS
jgi:hypothetical protein